MRFRLILLALLAVFALPAFAQEDPQHTVAFDDFSFRYDTTIAVDVNITYQSAEELSDIFPTMAPHIQFLLYSGDSAPAFPAEAPGLIRVFSTADFDEAQSGVLAQLQTLLDERPDLAGYMTADTTLPFLPIFPAGQVMRARAQYVETDAVTGISYVTAYMQALEPFTSSSFIYTFQGVSNDGAHYVSAIFRLNTDLFSDELPSDFDMAEFSEQYEIYLAESIAALTDADADAISPSLDTLDALIASFAFAE